MSNNKLETLQAIINSADIYNVNVSNYDMTQPGDWDESGSGGAWDMAGHVAMEILGDLYDINNDNLPDRTLGDIKDRWHQLLYNFITEYKDEQETDDE